MLQPQEVFSRDLAVLNMVNINLASPRRSWKPPR
jgi:hypothetical protein